jgi:hypothetical protein
MAKKAPKPSRVTLEPLTVERQKISNAPHRPAPVSTLPDYTAIRLDEGFTILRPRAPQPVALREVTEQ